MAVRIRLARHGKRKYPYYRIVAANHEDKRDGRFIEILGTYNPNVDPAEVNLKHDRVQYWMGQGARPSDTVASLFRKHLQPAE